jgi:hypothetical protein
MRQLSSIRLYEDLQAALRERSAELGMTRIALDAKAGLADGHASKLLAPAQPKRFGWTSLPLVLQALGVRLALLNDDESKFGPVGRPEPIDACASTMALRRAAKLSPDRRREIASKAGLARWHRR